MLAMANDNVICTPAFKGWVWAQTKNLPNCFVLQRVCLFHDWWRVDLNVVKRLRLFTIYSNFQEPDTYRQTSNISLKYISSRLAVVFVQSIEAKC